MAGTTRAVERLPDFSSYRGQKARLDHRRPCKSRADYLEAFDAYQKLWERLDAETASNVKAKNFERIFDAARVKVREWESAQIGK